MDVDDQRALARKLRRIGEIEQAGDLEAVKALGRHNPRFDIHGRIEPAGLALGPAGDLHRLGIERPHIRRAFGAVEGEAYLAPRRDLDPADLARGQGIDLGHLAARHIENAHPVRSGFIDLVDYGLAVIGNVETVDVPLLLRDRRERARGRIKAAETLEIGALIAGDPQRAVRRNFQAAIGNLGLGIADRGHCAGGEIEGVEIDILHRLVIGDIGARIAGREGDQRPAAALAFVHYPRRGGIARVHHIEIGIHAVAAGRAERHQLAVLAPRIGLVAALAIGQQREPPVLERVELVILVPAAILGHKQHIALGRGIGSRDRLGLETDLGARTHRHGDAVQLADIGKTGVDEHRAGVRVPPGKACAAGFEIGPHAGRQFQRDGRHLLGGQRCGDRQGGGFGCSGCRCRGDLCGDRHSGRSKQQSKQTGVRAHGQRSLSQDCPS